MVFEISIYVLITLICGILLIVMGMFGFGDFGDFDVGSADFDMDMGVDMDTGDFSFDHGDVGGGLSPLSLPLLLSFGTMFGVFGTVFTELDWNPILIPLASALVSALISVLLFLVMVNLFVKTQVDTTVNLQKLEGLDGEVSIAIKPPEIGQIMITTQERGRTLITATADDDIGAGTQVTIVKMMGSRAHVKRRTE